MLLCANVAQDAIASYFQHPENDTILLPPYKDKIKSTCHRIALSTGSSERWKSKQWGVENYCDLIQKLSQQGIKITLVGSKLEADDATYIQNRIPTVLNFVGKTSLGELKNILHSVDLYIGNDSGPTHIAAGVGTDTLTIFGSTGIKHCPAFEKYKGVHLYIKPDSSIACHPCYKGVCPTQHECMKNISVETVFSNYRTFKRSKMNPLKIVHCANFSESKYGAVYYAIDRKISNGLIRNGHFVYDFSYRKSRKTPLSLKVKNLESKMPITHFLKPLKI